MHIGIKNFRVFKRFTDFEIKPITFLIGPNNSGKSSFTKLLLLLKNGIGFLDFEKGEHKLETFEKSLNWESKEDDCLCLKYNSNISILSEDYFVKLKYKNAELKSVNLYNNITELFDFQIIKSETERNFPYYFYNLQFNIKSLIDLVYQKKIEVYGNRIQETRLKHPLGLLFPPKNDIDFSYVWESFRLNSNSDIESLIIQALYNEIDLLNKDYLLYKAYKVINGQEIEMPQEESGLNVHLQNEVFNKIQYTEEDFYGLNNASGMLEEVFRDLNNKAQSIIRNKVKAKYSFEIRIKETPLAHLIFKEPIFDREKVFREPFYDIEELYFKSSLFDSFQKIFKNIEIYTRNMEYISANRGSKNRIFLNKSENEIDEILLDYYKVIQAKKDEDLIRFEKFSSSILKIIGIEGKLIIERLENTVSVFYIQTKERKVNLADFGFGYSQVIPILLKIFILADNHKIKTLIIEEPEANLHPDLQSKLADIFVEANRYMPQINFIIETHSEYIIRRMQYLVAKKSISKNFVRIHYFNSDKYVTNQEPKVKVIEITEDGNLTDNFGAGFYDEATKLQFELMRLNKEQSN